MLVAAVSLVPSCPHGSFYVSHPDRMGAASSCGGNMEAASSCGGSMEAASSCGGSMETASSCGGSKEETTQAANEEMVQACLAGVKRRFVEHAYAAGVKRQVTSALQCPARIKLI